MAINIAAQDYIANKLAGTVRETTPVKEKLDYSEAEYVSIFNEVQKYITDEKLSELNKSLASGDTVVLESIAKTFIHRKYPRFANSDATLDELSNKCGTARCLRQRHAAGTLR